MFRQQVPQDRQERLQLFPSCSMTTGSLRVYKSAKACRQQGSFLAAAALLQQISSWLWHAVSMHRLTGQVPTSRAVASPPAAAAAAAHTLQASASTLQLLGRHVR